MIKPNELRVGNLVLHKGLPYQTNNPSEFLSVSYEPIPLTFGIMGKAGQYIEKMPTKDKEFIYSKIGTEILSVHELQNLYFALCGEELNINL